MASEDAAGMFIGSANTSKSADNSFSFWHTATASKTVTMSPFAFNASAKAAAIFASRP